MLFVGGPVPQRNHWQIQVYTYFFSLGASCTSEGPQGPEKDPKLKEQASQTLVLGGIVFHVCFDKTPETDLWSTIL